MSNTNNRMQNQEQGSVSEIPETAEVSRDSDLSKASFISANKEEEDGDYEFLCCSGSLLS